MRVQDNGENHSQPTREKQGFRLELLPSKYITYMSKVCEIVGS